MARKRTALEIDAEIAKLQREREETRVAEKAGVVARMKEAIAYYGITAATWDWAVPRAEHPVTPRSPGPKRVASSSRTMRATLGQASAPSPDGSPRRWPAARPRPICASPGTGSSKEGGGASAARGLLRQYRSYIGTGSPGPRMAGSL